MAEAGVVGVKVELGIVGPEEEELATLAFDVEEGLPDLGDEGEGGRRRPVWGPGACWGRLGTSDFLPDF